METTSKAPGTAGKNRGEQSGAVTDGSEDLSFDEVFENALEQAYALMNEMSGKEEGPRPATEEPPGETTPRPTASPASPYRGEGAGETVPPVTGTSDDTTNTASSGDSAISETKQPSLTTTPTNSSYEEAQETIAGAGGEDPEQTDRQTRAFVGGDAYVCDSSGGGQINKSSTGRDDPRDNLGLSESEGRNDYQGKTKDVQMEEGDKCDETGQSVIDHSATHTCATIGERGTTLTVSEDKPTDNPTIADMPALQIIPEDDNEKDYSAVEFPVGEIDDTTANDAILINESVSCNNSTTGDLCDEMPRIRTREMVERCSWEEKLPKEELIENWCRGRPLSSQHDDIREEIETFNKYADSFDQEKVDEELIKKSLNDPKALLRIIEKLTTGDFDLHDLDVDSVQHTHGELEKQCFNQSKRQQTSQNKASLGIDTSDQQENGERDGRKDKKRRRRFITREKAIDLPSYDVPEEEGPTPLQLSETKALNSSVSLDNESKDPLSPLSLCHRQSSLPSPSLNSPVHAQSQSPSKQDLPSQSSQDSNLDMYAIEKSATLPANFSLDNIRGGPTSHGVSKSSHPHIRSHTVDGPSSLPPSGTGHDRRYPYPSSKSLERSNTDYSPGYTPKVTPPFRGSHIDSNRPVGLHPSRRDSSGSDGSSMRGSVASLPGDVPFRGSQSQVARRDKVEKHNQQRPRSLYDSSTEANKEFSSIAEPGPLFIASSYDNLGSDDSRDKSPAATRLHRAKTLHGSDDVPKFPVPQSMRQQRLARSKTLGDRGKSPEFVEHSPVQGGRVPRETSRVSRDHARPTRGESVGAKLTRARTFNEEGIARPMMTRSISQTRPTYRDEDIQAFRERANFKPIIPEGSELPATTHGSHIEAFRAVQRPAEAVGVFQPDPSAIATLKAPEGNRILNTSPTSAFSRARAQDDGNLQLPGHRVHYDPRLGEGLSPRSSDSFSSPRAEKFSPRRDVNFRPGPRDTAHELSPMGREGSVESLRSSGSTRSSQSSSKGINLTEFSPRRAKSYRTGDRAKTVEISSIDRSGVDAFIAAHKPVQKERKPVQKYAEKQNRKPKEKWQAEPIPPWRDTSSDRKNDQDVPIGLQPRSAVKSDNAIPSDFNPVVKPIEVRPDPPFKTDKKLFDVAPEVPIGLQPISKGQDTPLGLPGDFKPVVIPVEMKKVPPKKDKGEEKELEKEQGKAEVEKTSEKVKQQDKTPKVTDKEPLKDKPSEKETVKNEAKISLSTKKERDYNSNLTAVKKAIDELAAEKNSDQRPVKKFNRVDRTPTLARKWSSKAEPQQQSKPQVVKDPITSKQSFVDKKDQQGTQSDKSLDKKAQPTEVKPEPEKSKKEAVELARLVPEPVKRKPNEQNFHLSKQTSNDNIKTAEKKEKVSSAAPITDKSDQQTAISKITDRSEKGYKRKPSEPVSLVKARMSNFREPEKTVGSPRTARKTQVSKSVLKLNKQVSDSVLDTTPPRDVQVVLKEQAAYPKPEAPQSPRLERAKQTIVPARAAETRVVIDPPKVESPKPLSKVSSAVEPLTSLHRDYSHSHSPSSETSQVSAASASKKHLGVTSNASLSLREHSPSHKERSSSVKDAKDMFSRESSIDVDKPRRNFKIPQKRIDKIPEQRFVGGTLNDKLAMFRDEKRRELAVKQPNPSGRSASLDITDRRDSTGFGRFARRRPTSGESIEESPAEALPETRPNPNIDDVLAPISHAISSLVDRMPDQASPVLSPALLSPLMMSPPVMTSPPAVMTSPAPIATSSITITNSPNMSRKTVTLTDNKRSNNNNNNIYRKDTSPNAMLSPVFKFPPSISSPPGSPITRIKQRIQKSPSPNAVKSPAGVLHANTASVGQLKSPPPISIKSNTLGVISVSQVKHKEKDRSPLLMKSETLSSSYVPSTTKQQEKLQASTTASTAKLTLSAAKDSSKPKQTAKNVIKVTSKGGKVESHSDSQTGPLSPPVSLHSGEFRSMQELSPRSVQAQLPDVVSIIDKKINNNNDKDDRSPENIAVAMEALDSAIALLDSVSLEAKAKLPQETMETIAAMPVSVLASIPASAVKSSATPQAAVSLNEPLIVEVSKPTVQKAPANKITRRDVKGVSKLPDLTNNGGAANTSVVLATSTVMTPIQSNVDMATNPKLRKPASSTANGVPTNDASPYRIEGYPANMSQPVATVPPIARYKDVTRTTDSGMHKTITSAREYRGLPRRLTADDDSESIVSSEESYTDDSSSSSLSSEPPQEETPEQRRNRLMRSDSFNRPDSPEVEPLPLPKDSVILRSRLRRMDSSSSTDSDSTPPRSPRVSPRMPRKPKSLRQMLESANLRGFDADGPSSRAHLGVPKAAMWRRRRSKARVFAVSQIQQTMLRKRRSRSRSHSRSRKTPSHHGSYQDFTVAFQKQVHLHRPPEGGGRLGRARTREGQPPTQVVTPLEEPISMPWTVPWSKKKTRGEKSGKEQVARARRVRDKVTSSAIKGRSARSRSKSASSTRRRHAMLTEVPYNHPNYGTVKSKLTTAMLNRSLRRRKDDPYIN